jgi:stress-induced morphogen
MKNAMAKELMEIFEATYLHITDDSHKHAGHKGVEGRSGNTHFNIIIHSLQFEGKSLVQRHRMVYDSLQSFIDKGVHAIQIKAKTPAEANNG